MCSKEEVRQVVKEEAADERRRIATIEEIIKDLPSILTHIEDTLKNHTDAHTRIELSVRKVDEKISFTNGKVADLIKWREQVKGASMALKGVWGLLAIFVVASIFGMFYMWVEFQSIDYRIRDVLVKELENYQLEVVN